MTQRALATLLCLAVTLTSMTALAGDLGISITQEGCGDLDLGEVERIIGIEIEGMVEAEERSGELSLRIVCKTDGVHIKATEAETGHELERTTPALDENEEQPERVIALAASQLLIASWREIRDLRDAREKLEELRESYARGEFSKTEYDRRRAKLSALYLGEGEVADDACANITCSFHGTCVIENFEPVCICDSDSEPVPGTITDCVPSVPGWPRGAAITGFATAALQGLMGGFTVWGRAAGGNEIVYVDMGLIAIMGPFVGGGAHQTRRHPDVDGNVAALVAASGLYTLSLTGAVLDVVLLDPALPWFTATWTGIGALSLLLFSVDAMAAYDQALAARDGAPAAADEDRPRIWTWIAFGSAGAAAVIAAITGPLAFKEKSELDDACLDNLWGAVDDACPGGSTDGYEGFQSKAATALIMIELAAVTTMVGATLYFLEPRLSATPTVSNVSLIPYAVPGGAGLAFGGRF